MKKFCLIDVDYTVHFSSAVEGTPVYTRSDRISAYLYYKPKNEKQKRKNEQAIMDALIDRVCYNFKTLSIYFKLTDIKYEVIGYNIIGYMYLTENYFIDLTAPIPYHED